MTKEASPAGSDQEQEPLNAADIYKIKRATREGLRLDSEANTVESPVQEVSEGPLEWRGEIDPIPLPEDPDRVAKRIAKAVGAGLTRDSNLPPVQNSGVRYYDGPEGSYIGVDSKGNKVDMIFPDEWEH